MLTVVVWNPKELEMSFMSVTFTVPRTKVVRYEHTWHLAMASIARSVLLLGGCVLRGDQLALWRKGCDLKSAVRCISKASFGRSRIMSKLDEFKYASSGSSEEEVASVRVASSLDEEHLNEGGAAVEEHSPLGQQIGWFSVICLNISQMVSATIQCG